MLVNNDLTIPDHPEVQVIGDLANFPHQTGKPLPGVSPVAMQQGRHAARNILAMVDGRKPQRFWYWGQRQHGHDRTQQSRGGFEFHPPERTTGVARLALYPCDFSRRLPQSTRGAFFNGPGLISPSIKARDSSREASSPNCGRRPNESLAEAMRARYILPNFRIAVVGAGAIGGYYGAKLGYFGRDVHFLMRGDLREVRRFGIRIKGKTENIRLAKVNAYGTTPEIGPCDLVLVAVKTTANQDFVRLDSTAAEERDDAAHAAERLG